MFDGAGHVVHFLKAWVGFDLYIRGGDVMLQMLDVLRKVFEVLDGISFRLVTLPLRSLHFNGNYNLRRGDEGSPVDLLFRSYVRSCLIKLQELVQVILGCFVFKGRWLFYMVTGIPRWLL
ncbi:hypothetical protein OUZ56_023026 [Daphnia magna]|uniref:Uncharacterized protein n=1 Tax=Daphnia magna TaxID=35525 RepID=A0ABR0AY80_9CRUS|nr:hypothetical protein OUZ56_023026 [Daphnia magna]